MSAIEYINSIVLTANTSPVVFSNIPQNYTDLKIIFEGTYSSGGVDNAFMRFNSDASTNYSVTFNIATGSSFSSSRVSNVTSCYIGQLSINAGERSLLEVDINSYSNTSIFKTILSSSYTPQYRVSNWVNLWRSTSAINSIEISGSTTFASGSSATIWGIR